MSFEIYNKRRWYHKYEPQYLEWKEYAQTKLRELVIWSKDYKSVDGDKLVKIIDYGILTLLTVQGFSFLDDLWFAYQGDDTQVFLYVMTTIMASFTAVFWCFLMIESKSRFNRYRKMTEQHQDDMLNTMQEMFETLEEKDDMIKDLREKVVFLTKGK